MNPDDLIISTDYSGVTVSVDDYWNEMTDPRDEDQDAFKSINLVLCLCPKNPVDLLCVWEHFW